MIYFDNSATTAMAPEVLKTYTEVVTRVMGNPSSLHHLGVTAARLLEASRRQIAELLGVGPSEIFFTSGGTEADNWAIKGVAWEKKRYGKHLLISAIEHSAVKEAAHWLTNEGFEVEEIPVSADGLVSADSVTALLREDTVLVSVMAVNNEIGSVQPIAEIAERLKDRPTVSFHVDAVQAIGKIPVSQWLLPRVDFLSLSAHKFHGPRGVGILLVKSGKKITPLLHGGGQERGLRSTTENLAGIVATAKALRLTLADEDKKRERVSQMKATILSALTSYEKVILFSQREHFAPNILTWGIKGIRGEVVVHAFEEHEIYLSTTSACSSKKKATASTLIAMQVKPEIAQTAVRISLDESNTMTEVEQFLTIFRQIYSKLT